LHGFEEAFLLIRTEIDSGLTACSLPRLLLTGYRLVGGTRQRHFDRISCKPRKLPENAQTLTTMAPTFFVGDRVHAVFGAFDMLV